MTVKHVFIVSRIRIIIFFGLLLLGCNYVDKKNNSTINQKLLTTTVDIEQIKQLIREVLIWADTKNSIILLPVLTDSKDSVYTGFDIEIHKQNLDKLRQTDFFSDEFIENYNQIILTLDQGIKNGRYDQWFVDNLPTFIFANDYSPWCNCQDNDDWNEVEVRVINLNEREGEMEWIWGNISIDSNSSWKDFRYKFRVVKDNNKWRISFLEGFDFNKSTQRDGQL